MIPASGGLIGQRSNLRQGAGALDGVVNADPSLWRTGGRRVARCRILRHALPEKYDLSQPGRKLCGIKATSHMLRGSEPIKELEKLLFSRILEDLNRRWQPRWWRRGSPEIVEAASC